MSYWERRGRNGREERWGEEWERGEGEREKRREGRKEERSEEEGRRPIKETYSKCWLHTFLSPSYPALHPHTLIYT